MKALNLGCGKRFHRDWVNVDFVSTGKEVIAYNLREGIPFPNHHFEIVYHSHVLEHFTKDNAANFIKECCRVLRPDGILRVVVPDLENIVRTYLTSLEKASSGSQAWASNYDWMMLELYDQSVRNISMGEMGTFLLNSELVNEEFILERGGSELEKIIKKGRKIQQSQERLDSNHPLKAFLKHLYLSLKDATYRRESWLKFLLGKDYENLQIGRFRQGGEVHQWMYDYYSLSLLLKQCDLRDVVKRSASDSYLANWRQWNLDTEPDGSVYKPASLYVEAIKPNL